MPAVTHCSRAGRERCAVLSEGACAFKQGCASSVRVQARSGLGEFSTSSPRRPGAQGACGRFPRGLRSRGPEGRQGLPHHQRLRRTTTTCAASAVIINSDGVNFIYTSTLRPGAGRPGPAQAAGNALFTMSTAIGLPTVAACVRSSFLTSSSSRIFMRFSSARSGP